MDKNIKIIKDPENGVRLAREDYLEKISKIKYIAFDMDGTIYKGSELFDFTNSALEKLKNSNLKYSFLTNNPSKNVDDYLEKLCQMGVSAKREDIYTSALSAIDFLKEKKPEIKKMFFVGTKSMIAEFEKAGYISTSDSPDDVPDAVMVGFDLELDYAKLCRAAWWVSQKKPYFATNPDRVCPTNLPTVLVDCASICAAVNTATGRTPDITFGKPDPSMLTGIMMRENLQADEIAMVGDRIYTDTMTAHNAGAFGVLVLSGEATVGDALSAENPPDITIDNIEILSYLISKTK